MTAKGTKRLYAKLGPLNVDQANVCDFFENPGSLIGCRAALLVPYFGGRCPAFPARHFSVRKGWFTLAPPIFWRESGVFPMT